MPLLHGVDVAPARDHALVACRSRAAAGGSLRSDGWAGQLGYCAEMVNMQLADMPTCRHCWRPQRGRASVYGEPVCHPDQGMDCYHLVTVYGHPMPCDKCKLQISEGEESP